MSESTPILIPQEIVNDETVTILQWKIPTGARVEAGQVLAELETSKTAFDFPAPMAGYVHYTLAVGAEPAIGSVLCHISDSAERPGGHDAPKIAAAPTNGHAKIHKEAAVETAIDVISIDHPAPDRTVEFGAARFSKKAAALVAQHNLDPALFDKRGLVREHDVQRLIGGPPADIAPLAPIVQTTAPARSVAAPVAAAGVPVRDEVLSRAKRTEIKYLASGTANSLTSIVSVSVPTRGLRAAVETLGPVGGNATAVILFESARLLKKYPLFNAYYDDGHAKLYEQVNIGLAVDAGKGLKVPVIRQADVKSIAQVSDEIGETVQAYLSDTLSVESLAGGTFTLTDLSGEGITYFHPLINRGQAAILGVGAEHFPPGSKEGVFNLILAFDHQLADGRMAGKFLGELSDRLTAYERAAGSPAPPAHSGAALRCSNCRRTISPTDKHNRFLVPVILPDGSDGRLCLICFDGWM
ncbi:MAG TPA: 2-oxo acid dehydrogenase subunit E2 [Tepidisphaeraceae bacterium]|jgi:2-oxoglutarate dehydrogenase E2 component (dihydrolipoamide succinyltransferase)|nr:2-oxo acid dehydrogenase subunit E2 [Tepidisphaeraceae bacterium]